MTPAPWTSWRNTGALAGLTTAIFTTAAADTLGHLWTLPVAAAGAVVGAISGGHLWEHIERRRARSRAAAVTAAKLRNYRTFHPRRWGGAA